jgi:hypothetical protein
VLQAWFTQLGDASPGGKGPPPASLARQMQLNELHTHASALPNFVHWQLN